MTTDGWAEVFDRAVRGARGRLLPVALGNRPPLVWIDGGMCERHTQLTQRVLFCRSRHAMTWVEFASGMESVTLSTPARPHTRYSSLQCLRRALRRCFPASYETLFMKGSL